MSKECEKISKFAVRFPNPYRSVALILMKTRYACSFSGCSYKRSEVEFRYNNSKDIKFLSYFIKNDKKESA
ncbi:hypothetical protein [uncultured Campylobacter sp.]|uniref:hypothetical protein n=1 Tax=uncultured Campylobacter sp. TaxID=218934 RepID=UPI00260ECA0D|nr:hypothetical protein [uncultured Campylobacter sp.]